MKHKGQTKLHSLYESLMNISVGYGVALASQLIIFPIYGGTFSFSDNIKIGIWFTVISFIRSFFLRRIFNWIMLYGHKIRHWFDKWMYIIFGIKTELYNIKYLCYKIKKKGGNIMKKLFIALMFVLVSCFAINMANADESTWLEAGVDYYPSYTYNVIYHNPMFFNEYGIDCMALATTNGVGVSCNWQLYNCEQYGIGCSAGGSGDESDINIKINRPDVH